MENKVCMVFRKKITIKEKQEMISKYLSGVKFKQLRKEYGYASSTISSILKNREDIMKIKPTIASTTLSKGRDIIAEMEILLHKWIMSTKEDLTKNAIVEKALEIFRILRNKSHTGDVDRYHDFKASRGWFERFKRRFNLDDKPPSVNFVCRENAELECDNYVEVVEEEEEEEPATGISPEELSSLIQAWGLVKELVVHHPNLEMAEHACAFFETAIMKYFRTLRCEEEEEEDQANADGYDSNCEYQICHESFESVKKEIEE